MFRVEWTSDALDELANVWMAADQDARRAITEATQRIDRTLAEDPFGASESRTDVLRIAFETPLGLSFEADQDTKSVQVVSVWSIRKRGR